MKRNFISSRKSSSFNVIICRFKSNITRDKPHPRMLISEEAYVEPTKLERLSLRDTDKGQWVTDKVCSSIDSSFHHYFFLQGFRSLVHGIPEFDKFETTYVQPHFYYSTT